MSFGSQQIYTHTITVQADPGGDGEMFVGFKAAAGLTILNVYGYAEQTQNDGTAIQMRLENWGQGGTAVEGTITAYLGGTASGARLTARTPATATIDSAQDYIDSGDWIMARYEEEGAGWIAGDRMSLTFSYVYGVGA